MKHYTLLLDIGGVLLTNGWDHKMRAEVSKIFSLEAEEFQARHALMFDAFERGGISFDDYLTKVIFYKKRPFSLSEMKSFAFESARAYPEMIEMVKALKKEYHLKVGVLSNEGRELAEDRIERFELGTFVDFFVVSSFVGHRKPEREIYQFALDVAQSKPSQTLYIDDRKLLVEVGSHLGLQAIWHQNTASTKELCEAFLTQNLSYL